MSNVLIDGHLFEFCVPVGYCFLFVSLIAVCNVPQPPKPDDLALVCFTSGTTGKPSIQSRTETLYMCEHVHVYLILMRVLPGNPKGAMLTHGNVISNTAAFLELTEVNNRSMLMWGSIVKITFNLTQHQQIVCKDRTGTKIPLR